MNGKVIEYKILNRPTAELNLLEQEMNNLSADGWVFSDVQSGQTIDSRTITPHLYVTGRKFKN